MEFHQQQKSTTLWLQNCFLFSYLSIFMAKVLVHFNLIRMMIVEVHG